MHLVLRLDVSGRPMAWETWEEAAAHYVRGNVAWTLGNPFFTAHGGICLLYTSPSPRD